jgi:mutator protein MutT
MIVKPPVFCQRCGGTLDYSDRSGSDRSPVIHPVCVKCGRTDHLDPKLCACALVVDRGKILLARRAADQVEAGRWNLPGGFVDRGETVEAAAAREVFEETGLEVEIGLLIGVFSYPGDPVVVVVHEARPMSGRLAPGDESDDAAWFGRNEIPWDALAFRSSADALKKFFAIG